MVLVRGKNSEYMIREQVNGKNMALQSPVRFFMVGVQPGVILGSMDDEEVRYYRY